jgi:catechol 2,3-dioxygenase
MAEVRIKLGSVRLRVRDVARSEAFYRTALGLDVTERVGSHVFLAGDSEHFVLALEGVGIEEGGVSAHVGTSSVGWEVPDAWEFWRMHRRLQGARVQFVAEDEGVRWTLRFRDPDGNGVEIYVDSRELPGGRGTWEGATRPVDEALILAALQSSVPGILEYEG